jgi:hypothetical protein
MYKINQKEIEGVSALEPFKRYQYFIKRIVDWEIVYALRLFFLGIRL